MANNLVIKQNTFSFALDRTFRYRPSLVSCQILMVEAGRHSHFLPICFSSVDFEYLWVLLDENGVEPDNKLRLERTLRFDVLSKKRSRAGKVIN